MADMEQHDDDEDYGDEEDEEEPNAKRTRLSQYVDDEAAVDEDADEDADEDEGDLRDFIDNAGEERLTATQQRQLFKEGLTSKQDRTSGRLLSNLEQKYANSNLDYEEGDEADYEEEQGEEEGGTNHRAPHPSVRTIRQQQAMPTRADPKLFMIKCRPGKERESVILLLQKFVTAGDASQMEIQSAFSVDTQSGWIYVEAFKEPHVKTAIKDVAHLRESGMKLVPINEMSIALPLGKKSVELTKGQWIRIKRGIYKGDLAEVLGFDDNKQSAVVRLVPRMEEAEDEKNEGRKKKRASGVAPPQQMFDKEGKETELDKKPFPSYRIGISPLDVYKGKRFYNGFLIRAVPYKSIELKSVNPTMDEITKFSEGGSVGLSLGLLRQAIKYNKDDGIRVVEGELKNMIGSVISVSDDGKYVTFLPKHRLYTTPLRYPTSQIQKYFTEGTFCKVISGRYQGESGIISLCEGDMVLLHNSTKKLDFQVHTNEITAASTTSLNESTVGDYSLHDMVKIDANKFGVIVKVDKDVFKVLDNDGAVKTVQLQEMGPKRHPHSEYKTHDKNSSIVGVDDSVRVVDGVYSGRQGVVKHIYKNYLFCHAKDIIENSGVFVVRAKQCEVRGTTRNRMMAPPNTGGAGMSQMRPAFNRGDGRKRNTALLMKTVRIQKGLYKGYIGIVKDVTAEAVRIELHSQPKIVSVKLDDIREVDGEQRSSVPLASPITPRITPQTPRDFDRPKTPGGGSETPARTPFASDYPDTPSHQHNDSSAVWSSKRPNTPMHEAREFRQQQQQQQQQEQHSIPAARQPSIYSQFPPANNLPPRQVPITPAPSYPITPAPNYPITPGPSYPTTPGTYNYGYDGQQYGFNQSYSTSLPVNTPQPLGNHLPPQTPQPNSPATYTPMQNQTTSAVPTTPHMVMTPGVYGSGHNGIDTPMMSSSPYPPTTPMVQTPMVQTPMVHTPFAPADDDSHWATVGLEVSVDKGPLSGRIGVIKRVDSNSCFVLLDGENHEIEMATEILSTTPPSPGDQILVKSGNYAFQRGTLNTIDAKSREAIVSTPETGLIFVSYDVLAGFRK